jgi:hypothetical protein
MNVKTARVESLKVSVYNPPSRTEKVGLKHLRSSVSKRGILYPLLVTKDMTVIDGHRRLAVAKELGLEEVPIIILAGDDDRDVFMEINESARKLGTRDALWVYLRGGKVSEKLSIQIRHIDDVMGRAFLEKLLELRISPSSLWDVGMCVAIHCSYENDPEFISAVLGWLAAGRRQTMARRAVEQGAPAAVILSAIRRNEDLRLTWM